MRRRDVLRAGIGAGIGAAGLLASRRGRAQPFGDPSDPSYAAKLLPAGVRAESVLEIFLYGGLTLWETFHCVEEYGRPDDPDPTLQNTQYYTFNNPVTAGGGELAKALQLCGLADPSKPFSPVPFAKDALGASVKFGPLLQPLLARKDVVARTRLVVNRHDLQPHEAAIPLALCGRPLGAPTMASLGAHVQRYFLEHDQSARKSPYSYVLATNAGAPDNVKASVATGTHPGSARPLLVKVDDAARLGELLARKTVGDRRAEVDALMQVYVDRYRDRLRFGGHGDPLRAPQFQDVVQAATSVASSDAIASVLDPSLFSPITTTACGVGNLDAPAMAMRLAAHLLTHPTEPARYCCFVDPGLKLADGGGGYDTHVENSQTQTRNFVNTLSHLLAHVNAPGEGDPSKIDLDRTMIVLNMEFGRAPTAQNGGLGRNHWPHGYVQIYLGGPIRAAESGIFGAIGPDGVAHTWTTPAENRIACLLALGIWPFAADGFGVGDVQGFDADVEHPAADEVSGVVSVTDRILGHGEVA